MSGMPVVRTYDEFVGLWLNIRRVRTLAAEYNRVAMKSLQPGESLGREWHETISETADESNEQEFQEYAEWQTLQAMAEAKRMFGI